jgi:hypothetical protein
MQISTTQHRLHFNRLFHTHTCSQHVHHTLYAPRALASVHSNNNALRQGLHKRIDFLAAPKLVGIQVEHDKRDVGGELRDAVVCDVLDDPAKNGLKGDFVSVHKGRAETGAMAQGGQEGELLVACIGLLFGVSMWM